MSLSGSSITTLIKRLFMHLSLHLSVSYSPNDGVTWVPEVRGEFEAEI